MIHILRADIVNIFLQNAWGLFSSNGNKVFRKDNDVLMQDEVKYQLPLGLSAQ